MYGVVTIQSTLHVYTKINGSCKVDGTAHYAEDYATQSINPLGTVIEIHNLTACAMLVINCVQADANELFVFFGARCCFTAHEGGTTLVSRFFPNILGRIESGAVLWDLPG